MNAIKRVPSAHVLYSDITDPYINLAIEHYLFENLTADQPLLMLYHNEPSIIIGRAQNPWVECRFEQLTKMAIPVVRRQSGGGSVYHDQGNLNYTILTPKQLYDKRSNLQMLVGALAKLNIESYISKRNDLYVVDENNNQRKISGCAFREKKHKAFHHGTLLINADLNCIEHYLHHTGSNQIQTKAVSSVQSNVINLSEINPDADQMDYIQALRQTFASWFNVNDAIQTINHNDIKAISDINQKAQKLQSWAWFYGKTLPFQRTLWLKNNNAYCELTLKVKQGIIESYDLEQGHPHPWVVQYLNKMPGYEKFIHDCRNFIMSNCEYDF
jgi:lipoate-protein ligase A